MLEDLKKALSELYTAKASEPCTAVYSVKNESSSDSVRAHIYMGIFFSGEPAGVYYEEPKPHTVRLYSDEDFREWLDYVTFGYENYKEEIETVSARLGVMWDGAKGELFIEIRRNEMPLAEALMRLYQAMMITGSFRKYIFFNHEKS